MGSLVIYFKQTFLLLLFVTNCARLLLTAAPLPTTFGHTGDFAVQRELAETQPADTVLAEKPARPAAAPAAVAVTALELGRLIIFCDLGGCCHCLFSSSV
jgi:hypothetical protein